MLKKYRSLHSGILIDDLLPAGSEVYTLNAGTQAYEGFRFLEMYGLTEILSVKEQYEVINASLTRFPVEQKAGIPVRNIAVAKWFKNGEPLILHVSSFCIPQLSSGQLCPSFCDRTA